MTIDDAIFKAAVRAFGEKVNAIEKYNLLMAGGLNTIMMFDIRGLLYRFNIRNAVSAVLHGQVDPIMRDIYAHLAAFKSRGVATEYYNDGDPLPGKAEEDGRRAELQKKRREKGEKFVETYRNLEASEADRDDEEGLPMGETILLSEEDSTVGLQKACAAMVEITGSSEKMFYHLLRALDIPFAVSPYETDSCLAAMAMLGRFRGENRMMATEDLDGLVLAGEGIAVLSSFEDGARFNLTNGSGVIVVNDWFAKAKALSDPPSRRQFIADLNKKTKKARKRKAPGTEEGEELTRCGAPVCPGSCAATTVWLWPLCLPRSAGPTPPAFQRRGVL